MSFIFFTNKTDSPSTLHDHVKDRRRTFLRYTHIRAQHIYRDICSRNRAIVILSQESSNDPRLQYRLAFGGYIVSFFCGL